MPRLTPSHLTPRRLVPAMLAAAIAFALPGCNDKSDEPAPATPPAATTRTLTVSFTELPTLGANYEYEGWLITPTGAVSAGRFDMAGGAASPSSFQVPSTAALTATKYVLTIEPQVDADPTPSIVHVLAGSFASGSASLSITDADALPSFSSASGSYVLAAPTLPAGSDYTRGVWFLKTAPTAAALVLPVLPAGWTYEGWVIEASGVKHSTGRFRDPAAGDDNNPAGAPSFPGQDLSFSLVGSQIAISVEPVLDFSPDPFPIIPLMDAAVTATAEGASQLLASPTPATPTGMVIIATAG